MKYTKHHLIPRSRGGGNGEGNIAWKPKEVHEAWHTLFWNLLPEEAIGLIQTGHYVDLPEKHRAAWKLLFGDLTNDEVIAEIEEHWSP